MMHQPDPEKKPDLLAGLLAIRKMHIHAIEQTGLTAADEMLYPENYRYLSDPAFLCSDWSTFCRRPAASSGSQRPWTYRPV